MINANLNSFDYNTFFREFNKQACFFSIDQVVYFLNVNPHDIKIRLLALEYFIAKGYRFLFCEYSRLLLRSFPENQWIYYKVLELSLNHKLEDFGTFIFAAYFPSNIIADANKFYTLLTSYASLKSSLYEKVIWLSSLATSSPATNIVYCKIANLYFTNRSIKLALDSLYKIKDFSELPTTALKPLSLLVSYATNEFISLYLQNLHAVVLRTKSFDILFSLLVLNSQLFPSFDISFAFAGTFDSSINRWELLLWYNRYSLPHPIDGRFFEKVSNYYDNLTLPDYRWLFQYSLSLIRRHQLTKAQSILHDVSSNHLSLTHLAKPLLRALHNLSTHFRNEIHSNRLQTTMLNYLSPSAPLFVFFSGWYGAFSYFDHYVMSSLMSQYSCSTLSLHDPTHSWFTQGILPFGQSLETTASNLKTYLRSLTSGPIILVGSSISGLSASHYAEFIKPDLLLSFAGSYSFSQTSASSRSAGIHSYDEGSGGVKFSMRCNHVARIFPESSDLFKRLAANNINMHYVYSQFNAHDTHIYRCISNSLDIKSTVLLDTDSHSVSLYSLAYGMFDEIIQNSLDKL